MKVGSRVACLLCSVAVVTAVAPSVRAEEGGFKLEMPLGLDADLLAFLRSLEGDWKPVAPPALPQ